MLTPLTRLTELRRKVNGQEYVTPAENTLADDLLTLIEIVADIANETGNTRIAAAQAANVASCLANGIIPD